MKEPKVLTIQSMRFRSRLEWWACDMEANSRLIYFVEGNDQLRPHSPTWFTSAKKAVAAVEAAGYRAEVVR